ncbi:hypothetical protein CcCBS67573_g08513 [Chytriomyces confervae]|uniref:C2H2-type domain-containing protein n=1 Tax=Chytriomyces confervae TaxID=246404 RepID=A0A507EKY4_9FUNG|nr:hypothetical protein CcCBS67573_g08513 [Chytriomyces confervae]
MDSSHLVASFPVLPPLSINRTSFTSDNSAAACTYFNHYPTPPSSFNSNAANSRRTSSCSTSSLSPPVLGPGGVNILDSPVLSSSTPDLALNAASPIPDYLLPEPHLMHPSFISIPSSAAAAAALAPPPFSRASGAMVFPQDTGKSLSTPTTPLGRVLSNPHTSNNTDQHRRVATTDATADVAAIVSENARRQIVFTCPHEGCQKSFMKHATFRAHYNEHTHARPHACECCSARFTRRHDYLRHVKSVHSSGAAGALPTCQSCQKGFSRIDSLKRHEKKCFESGVVCL